MSEFIKSHTRQIVFMVVIFLAASISFGLGMISASQLNNAPIIIQRCIPQAGQNATETTPNN